MTNTRKILHCTEGSRQSLLADFPRKMYVIIIGLLKTKSDKSATQIFDAETTYSMDDRIQWRKPGDMVIMPVFSNGQFSKEYYLFIV